ncbi:MAG: sodium:calcium antiporter [Blastocatellia bacterium]
MKNLFWLIVTCLIPMPWMFLALTGQAHSLSPGLVSVLSGLAIVSAAFMLSWGAELSERDIPRALALIFLALISVLPEYAIGLHYAWVSGYDPSYEGLSVANMTGANRVLIGVGWALVSIVYYFKHKQSSIPLDTSMSLELSVLLMATLYSLVLPLKGTLTWVDIVIFFAMFLYYAGRALGGEKHDEDLEGIAGELDRRLGNGARRAVVFGMFAFAGWVIWYSAEPFSEGLVHMGEGAGVDKFLLVQWLAPLASESPEALVALLFALKGKGSTGIGALISSKVNQWTLLVGALPLVYGLSTRASKGSFAPMLLDGRQKEELLLTSAQSLFAAIIIADFGFALWEALMLLVLFCVQLLFPDVRHAFSLLYLFLSVVLLLTSKKRREMVWRALTLRG